MSSLNPTVGPCQRCQPECHLVPTQLGSSFCELSQHTCQHQRVSSRSFCISLAKVSSASRITRFRISSTANTAGSTTPWLFSIWLPTPGTGLTARPAGLTGDVAALAGGAGLTAGAGTELTAAAAAWTSRTRVTITWLPSAQPILVLPAGRQHSKTGCTGWGGMAAAPICWIGLLQRSRAAAAEAQHPTSMPSIRTPSIPNSTFMIVASARFST